MKTGLLALFLFIGCACASLFAQTILIATESTPYKNALVKSLVSALEENNLNTEIVDHSKGELSGIDPGDFAVVYVLNSGARAQVRPRVIQWLNSVSDRDDNIVVHTTQRTRWIPDISVDSITSASKRSNIKDLTQEIVGTIQNKL